MRLVIDMEDSEIVCKESGELPEQFKAYIFVYNNNSKEYRAMVGFYHPSYDNNNGGVFDGIGTYMDWNQLIAWKCLEEMQVNCMPESDKRQKSTNMKQEIKWIPVTDRYPDSPRQVLVTYKYDDKFEVSIGEYWNLTLDAKKKYPEEFGFGLHNKNVIAWAELPKPYTVNSEC